MNRFIGKVVLFGFIVFIFLLIGASRLTIWWQGDYMSAFIDKFNHLKNANSPKIVFIGGSNLAFGMDSKTIAEYYNMPVVNMGLHAGIGLRFFLEGIKPYVKKNDIVVIVPEYAFFYDNYLGRGSHLSDLLVNVYPKGFFDLSFSQLTMTLSELPRYSMDNLFHSYIKGRAYKKYEHNLYARKSFNSFGDLTAHWGEPSYINYQYEERKIRRIDAKMLKDMDKYILFYQSKGVEVVILPPAIVETMAQSMKGEIQQVTETLAKNKNRAYQYFCPERYFLPDSLGYDTRYHFLKSGIDIRVQFLIEDLNMFLKENYAVK